MTPSFSSPGAGIEESPYVTSPLTQPRYRNRATFVQRWKVLRERNKNLPKLDFNAKANGIPKKFQAASSFSRSYTYDSMKLPSISTCSVVTGMSGKSVQSDGYRRKDKTTLQEQSVNSDSCTDLSTIGNFQEISANLSKSLQSLDERSSALEKGNSSHRYERITYQKHLSNRRRSTKGLEKEATMLYKEKTMVGSNTQSKKQSLPKDNADRQYMYVKNHKKERQKFPNILHTLKQDKENSKKEGKSDFHLLEQSGIYQIDLSSVRNEIPPASHAPHPPVGSAATERSYRQRRQQRNPKYGSANARARALEQKWRDDCECLRCDIMKRQYAEGDIDSYRNWGNYPCMVLTKSRTVDTYYDSD